MPNTKITAMPSLGGNQVPTDLVTAVDLSAAPANQNVKSTLNDLFSTLTKNVTDRAIRFQAPGSAPAVAAASEGALYHNGTAFLASSNGGAYEQLYTLTAQSAALVFAGPTSGPAATPTFRALALSDLPTLTTASLLGRSSAGTGTPEQITSTAALLSWLQNPISNNLSAAVTDSTGAGGALVFAFNPVLTNPRFNNIAAEPSGSGSNLLFTPSVGAVNHIEILNATAGSGPTIRPTGLSANQPLNLASRGTGIISCVGNRLRVTGDTAATAGILDLRGGNASLSGGQIRLHEVTTHGTNYIGFFAPDILASNLLFELPATDGTAGQVLSTDGAGILSWATRGTGTVSSVGLSAPSIFTVTNSPVTGSGTLALSLATQSAALVFAGPTSGGAAAPTFRALALTDLPVIQFPAGTEAAPSITTTGDTNTGIYFPGADLLGFVTGGQQRLRIGSTGNFAFGGAVATETRIVLAGIFPTGTASPRAIRITGTFNETIAANALVIQSLPSLGTGVSVPTLGHYVASNTLGGTLTTQVGFWADGLSAGTTNNYGFYGTATAAAGRWNFYAEGTAANYFAGNTGIGTNTFGASAAGVLALGNGTAPTTGPADTIQIYSTDLSAGNTMLSIHTEGTSVNANATAAATHRIAIRVNGTVYFLLANTAA